MRRIFCALLMGVAALSATADAIAASADTKIIAYYFHGAFRCHTCNVMEQYIKEAFAGPLRDAVAAGAVEFKSVDVEQPANRHFVEQYQLFTKALILSREAGGTEVAHKNLDKIWQLARNKQRFIDYVAAEVNAFMP